MESNNTKLPPNLNVQTPAPGSKTPGALDETRTDDIIKDDEELETEEGNETVEKTDKKKKGKKVEVDEDLLKKLIDINEKNTKEIERLAKREKILTEAADLKRLTKVEELRNQGKLIKSVNLACIDEKYVIFSKTLKNNVYFVQRNGNLEHVADQLIEYTFNDGSTAEYAPGVFSSMRKQVACEVIEESKNRDGETLLTVQTPDGEEIKVGLLFINM